MGLQVLDKRILVSIRFTTHFTSVDFLIKLHSGMTAPLVGREAMFVSESYTTLLTFVGSFPCV
jgi:hypothetical protein